MKLNWRPASERPKMGRRIVVFLGSEDPDCLFFSKAYSDVHGHYDYYVARSFQRESLFRTEKYYTPDDFTHWIYESDFKKVLP